MPDALQPAVCFGAVMHERHVQAHNRFVYPSAFLRLPLGRLDQVRAPLLGIERANLFSFRSRDHGALVRCICRLAVSGGQMLAHKRPWRHDLNVLPSGNIE